MTPLIDADVLRYEIGHCGQWPERDEDGDIVLDADGQPVIYYENFDKVAEMLDQKISEICAEVWATEPPVLYITNDRRLHKKVNKKLKKEGKEELEYQANFRDDVAKKKVYKGNRVAAKPFHYDNLTAYMFANYRVEVAIGMEADDLMSIHQYERVKGGQLDTIICSRDKDLRITPGMHFGWECGKQPQFGPKRVTEEGEIRITGKGKIVGTGLKFFYSQVLTGDQVDNVPGLPRCGPVAAINALQDTTTEGEMFEAVAALYEKKYGDAWREHMLEQCHLLWMVREMDEEGNPLMYVMYDERDNG